MKNHICIQHRSTSTRLPKKGFKVLHGKSLINHVYDRCREASENVLFLIPEDDIILQTRLEAEEIPYFKGDEFNVLTRYVQAAKHYNMEVITRITGDCPFIPPENITHSLHLMKAHNADFVSNCIHPCVDGFEVDIFNRKALSWMHKHTPRNKREHVTLHLKEQLPAELKIISWSTPIFNFPKLSIDTTGDLERCRNITISPDTEIL